MTIGIQSLQAPKNGSASQECQDAVAWDDQKTTFAIADGVSDSAFQRLWANILVNSFVADARTLHSFSKAWLANWLRSQQSVWHSQVNWETIPWHGRLKAQQTGAQATFLGIRLLPDRRSWVGIAIGDCNLFRFSKDGTLRESIPNIQSADFSNATQAFSSTVQNQDQMLSQVKLIQGTFEPGDSIVLATDAMARWMLERLETQRNPLQEIPASVEPGVFDQWVSAQRRSGALKDDDTSLLLIRVDPVTLPSPRPVPIPLPPRRANRVWAYAYAIGLLLALLAGVVLGASFNNWLSNKRIEQNVQKPLLTLQQKLESNQSSRTEIGERLLRIIVTAQPQTGTGGTARDILCNRLPKDPGCTPTPTPTPKGGSRSK
jgi:hypothetical protein